VIHIRQFHWIDYDAVVAVWTAAGRDVLPRAELEAKLTRDPELFLVAETDGEVVAVIMGSTSDWETMRHADELLTRFGVPHECAVVSAHRTPTWMAEYGAAAEGRGLEVIIAGAGGALLWYGAVRRIGAADTPVGYAPVLEEAILPQVDGITTAIRELALY